MLTSRAPSSPACERGRDECEQTNDEAARGGRGDVEVNLENKNGKERKKRREREQPKWPRTPPKKKNGGAHRRANRDHNHNRKKGGISRAHSRESPTQCRTQLCELKRKHSGRGSRSECGTRVAESKTWLRVAHRLDMRLRSSTTRGRERQQKRERQQRTGCLAATSVLCPR